MKLHTVLFGKSKKKLRPIMTDSYEKCKTFVKAREVTPQVGGFHAIIEGGEEKFKESSTIGGYKQDGSGRNGYISKRGFQPHT